MNTLQQRVDELREEVDRAVGEIGSFASQECVESYVVLVNQGIPHASARIAAIAGTIGTLQSRAWLADDIHPENAFALRRHALALRRALEEGVA